MRAVNQMQKGLTELERKHLEFVNEKETSKDRTSTYTRPKIFQEINNRNRSKIQILNPVPKMKQMYANYGEKFMVQENPIALIIFAGGYGCRANLENGQPKQFSKIYQEDRQGKHRKKNQQPPIRQTTLFQILFQSLKVPLSKNKKIILYIIHSRNNSQQVAEEIDAIIGQNFQSLSIKLCYQTEQTIMDWNGIESVYVSKSEDKKLTYPNGIGSFPKAKIIYGEDQEYSLGFHITEISKPKLVYCVGTANKNEVGINLELIGLITQQNLSCVFQCSLSDSTPYNLPLVCIREESGFDPAWLVMQYENLETLVLKKEELKNYPIWMDNFVFDPKILKQEYKYNKSELRYQFNNRKLKAHNGNELNCIIPQVTISFAVMRNKQSCLGYLCPEGRFMKTKQDFMKSELDAKSLSPSRIVKRSQP